MNVFVIHSGERECQPMSAVSIVVLFGRDIGKYGKQGESMYEDTYQNL